MLTEHLGLDKHDASSSPKDDVRNGTRSKTVLTEASGHVQIDVPRDRNATLESQIGRKRQRRLSDADEMVISLYAKGLTMGDISAWSCLATPTAFSTSSGLPAAVVAHVAEHAIGDLSQRSDSKTCGSDTAV